MPNFNIDPAILAQLAAAGFRPPPTPQMPGLNFRASQQEPGFNLGDGMALAGMGLQALGGMGGGGMPAGASAVTQAPGFGAGLSGAGQDILGQAHDMWMRNIDPLTGLPRAGAGYMPSF